MEFVVPAMDDLCIAQEGGRRGRLGQRTVDYDDTKEYKSKNLGAERRRRKKLSERLLALRASVPIITNMNKATIIEDAITYIQELQKHVKHLSDQLLEMDELSEEAVKTRSDEFDPAEEMKQCGIMEDVQVTYVDETKLWIKIILEKKRGRFTRLIEALSYLGLELTETTVTTYRGAMLVSSFVEGAYGDTLTVQQTKEYLLEIIRTI
ncbi:DNA binding protein, putative [Ricinus communis]|uniref:DNA binding protein, putative n=1 Tax=Ricinus communis TaxID=3988 RepID=B9RXW8_RICCO|nr:DNA binding protein, putative [Ricinus communis]|eukprot:XP_002518587.1 transcription factor DYT1 [Ricinus communis]